jgi:acetoin utilization deacetylase AcuC-like enzyme
MVPIVYSPRYNITAFGLERLHPFDGRKYDRIQRWLGRQGLRGPRDFVSPAPVTPAELLRVHSPQYLASLRRSRVLAGILELPFLAYLPAWRVLRPMRWAAGGTVPLPPRTNGEEYMALVRERLPKALDQMRPDLVLYNVGGDVLWSDPLSRPSATGGYGPRVRQGDL